VGLLRSAAARRSVGATTPVTGSWPRWPA